MIVMDASAIVDLVLQTEVGLVIEERAFASGETLHAPYLVDLEVAQALRNSCDRGMTTAPRAAEALTDFSGIQVERYPHVLLLPRIWALRNNLTAYDAAYVALAEVLDAPLLTRDRRLARSAGHEAVVECL